MSIAPPADLTKEQLIVENQYLRKSIQHWLESSARWEDQYRRAESDCCRAIELCKQAHAALEKTTWLDRLLRRFRCLQN